MGRKRKNNKIAKVHPELEGLSLKINEFGEIESNIDITKINEFLTENVPDKKLMNRRDDAYQQEFKAQLGDKALDDDEDPYFEEPKEPTDDKPDFLAEEE
ncbi:MAG: hypothetical protein M3Q97_02220 [Bacteroidota bacterium]|nr:hypothetical protein [Bacteroidota bacterium]